MMNWEPLDLWVVVTFRMACLPALSITSFYAQSHDPSAWPLQVSRRVRGSEKRSFGSRSAGVVPSPACHQPVLSALSQKGVLAFIVTNGDDWLESSAKFPRWNPTPSEIHVVSRCITNWDLDQGPRKFGQSSRTTLTNPDSLSYRFQPVFTPTGAKFHTIRGPVSVFWGELKEARAGLVCSWLFFSIEWVSVEFLGLGWGRGECAGAACEVS